ncbi:MAG: hypothetical protein ACRDQF_21405, partial [Thermocrispum sp.]
MSSCCRAGPCEQMFGPGVARWDLRRYRKRGVGRVERRMLASVTTRGLDPRARVLVIGGGIGALQTELLLAGADRGEVVELVAAYEPCARELAEGAGLTGRTSFRVLDLLDEPEEARPADIVVLNRVVCCSADGLDLTAAAARLTRGTLLLSYPRDRWWIRLLSRTQNAAFWLVRRRFRSFVRPAGAIVGAAESEGLQVVDSGRGPVWE